MFTYLVDLSVVTVAIPYFFSAFAQLAYLVSRRRRVQGWHWLVTWCRRSRACCSPVGHVRLRLPGRVPGARLFLVGLVPLYAFLNARRERLGELPEPVDSESSTTRSARRPKR